MTPFLRRRAANFTTCRTNAPFLRVKYRPCLLERLTRHSRRSFPSPPGAFGHERPRRGHGPGWRTSRTIDSQAFCERAACGIMCFPLGTRAFTIDSPPNLNPVPRAFRCQAAPAHCHGSHPRVSWAHGNGHRERGHQERHDLRHCLRRMDTH